MRNAWFAPAIGAGLAAIGVYQLAGAHTAWEYAWGAVILLAGAGYALAGARRRLDYVDQRSAAAAGSRGEVVAYVRPGCPFCNRLIRATRAQRDRIVWVDIWQDDEAAAFVRSVNDGNEVVPTVVIDGTPRTNPDPRLVLGALR
ncbi:MAG: glutaredoxin domain-containing protein [Actinomycetales bacterium]